MKRLIAIAAVALALGSCAHGQRSTHTPMTGCDHPTGWSDQTRNTAKETWLHAQMAANAYKKPVTFDLGEQISEHQRGKNDDIGFAYVIYERRAESGPSSWVIAYRGTENDKDPLVDWVQGNLLGRQNKRGLKVYRDLRAKVGADATISVTGHSLGGGIATYVSMCEPGVNSYIFNASPRFWRCSREWIKNMRYSVVETGEILRIARGPLAEPTQRYTQLNCVRTGNSIDQHDMGKLARCLTDIAAWGDDDAKASLSRNQIAWPVAVKAEVVAARRRACPSGPEGVGGALLR